MVCFHNYANEADFSPSHWFRSVLCLYTCVYLTVKSPAHGKMALRITVTDCSCVNHSFTDTQEHICLSAVMNFRC